MLKRKCFSINSYKQIEKIINLNNKNKLIIIYIKDYLIKSFGIEWLSTLIRLTNKNYSQYNIKFFVDAGNDYGLSILIMRERIKYLKLRSNKTIIKKICQIAKKNKVLLNPNFNIVNVSKIKKYEN